ncbi:MAG: hypothetical protein CML61_10310 [Rhodobacteraceae bacterium]|nr:hypothetical protein [Paracoccaceae bacterium]
MEVPMLDRRQIERLRSDLGQEELEKIARIFAAEARETLVTLSTERDPDRRDMHLHGLCGSARTLGLSSLAAACQRGESAAELGRRVEQSLAAFAELTRVR